MSRIFSLRHLTLATAAFVLTLSAGTASEAGFKRSNDMVKVTARKGRPTANGLVPITVNVEIAKGYYIYANPVGDKDFAVNATVVTVKSAGKKVPAHVIYPKGKTKTDGKFTFNIYKGTATIQAYIRPTAAALEVDVRVNACDKSGCLPPGSKKVKVR